MTKVAFPGLTKSEDLFKGIVWDNLIKAGTESLLKALPFLSIWPIGPIIRFVINKFSNYLFENLRLMVDLKAIAFVNDKDRKKFDEHAVKLKILERDYGLNSKQYKEERNKAHERFSQLVRYSALYNRNL